MEWLDVLTNVIQTKAIPQLVPRLQSATLFGAGCLVFFYICGRLSRVAPGQYISRGFLSDLFFWFYYRVGVHQLLLSYWMFQFLGPRMPQFNLLEDLSYWPRLLIFYVIADFNSYWFHRMRHKVRWMWAFHTMHHSPERMTFATELRTHPVEMITAEFLMYLPLFPLGAAPEYWGPLAFLRAMSEVAQHSELPWRFGPLYYVFVSPAFHSFHHSVDQRHYDKNFGVNLSIWDFMFGTAVDERTLPARFGLTDVKMPDVRTQLLLPFRMIWNSYRPVRPAELGAVKGAD